MIQIMRILRGIEYFLRYIFLELPRGLDFSLRSKNYNITNAGNNGYALTSKAALKNILSHVPHHGKSILDIGSGKGGVICFAADLGLRKCVGIECEEYLHRIALQNISKLGLEEKVSSVLADARFYEDYGEFDIYFLFNPFNYEIYSAVVERIIQQNRYIALKKEKVLICYGDANLKAISETGSFEMLFEGVCPYRLNTFRIYRLV